MTFAYHDHDDDDDDDDDLFIQQCGLELHALRDSCRINVPGNASVLPRSCNDSQEATDPLLCSSVDDGGDDNEDDDGLLLSIQKRFGINSQISSRPHFGSHGQSLEEEDDEEILETIRQRFGSTKVAQGNVRRSPVTKLKPYRKRSQGGANKTNCMSVKSEKTGNSCKAKKEIEPVLPQVGDVRDIESVPHPAEDDTNDIESVPAPVEPTTTSDISCNWSSFDVSPEPVEPIAFSLPGQVEILDDNLESFAEESMDGVVLNRQSSSDVLPELQGESSKSTLNALRKNRRFQEVLKKKLHLIEKKLQENAELKKQVKAIIELQNSRACRVPSFGCNMKKSTETGSKSSKNQPPENVDVAKLRAVQKKHSLEVEIKAWSTQERVELMKGVKQQIQGSRMLATMESFNAESDDPNALENQLKAISDEPLTAHDIRASLALVNWDEVARTYVTGHTASECWIQWSNYEDPLIYKGPWTKSEDKRLWSIARKHKHCNWVQIARELGGHRSVSQCLMRYQRSLNAGIMRTNWTEEEDKQLREAVEQFGDQDWQSVASKLEGRTGTQCWNRWSKILHPMRKKSGRWDVTEDKRLKMAVAIYGARKWKMIATHVPGRTEAQCRERWCNVLDPSLSYEAWTEEEDLKLDEAVKKHGYRWSTIANDLKPRTDNQCWRRWKHLHPNDVLALQKSNKIQKVALMHNFVGRKKERPALEPSDFITHQSICLEDNQTTKKRRRASDGPPTTSKKQKTETSKMKAGMRSGTKKLCMARSEKLAVRRKVVGEKVANTAKLGKGQLNPRTRGARAFVKFLQEVAHICEDNLTDKDGANKKPFAATDKVDITIGASSVSSPAQEAEETEENAIVEEAVRAVLSWPFFCALKNLWRPEN